PQFTMTTVTVTTEVPPRGKTEGDSVSYGSSSAHIIEETEYVKKIRTTLEKIRNHMFKDEEGHGNANYKLDAEQSGNVQNGSDSATDPTCLDLLMENMRRKDQQLLEMNRENEMLKIKMEALKNTLKEQDKKIENLKEKVHILESQNKELKTKVAQWTETPKISVSKAVSTSELKSEGASPYMMLIRLRK
ncbi:hypothetical protein STEG23_027805, partial [Scotinomys teguina]